MAKQSNIVSQNSPETLGLLQDPYDFSLILGGPLYQLLRRAYLSGEELELLGRRILVIPQLVRAKRTGLREYGVLAQRYVREFDHKWLRGGAAADEPLVGSGDIQSLADLANSFGVIRTMRVVPFTKETLLLLLVTPLAPVLPLTLTMVPLEELLRRLLGLLF
jgi:hypothetical protein